MGKGFGLFCFLWLFLISYCHAQKQNNIWYFGNGEGLDFNSDIPTALTDGQLSTPEGSASIADRYGKLLFYSDGNIIWDRRHKYMDNGQGLSGSTSATQPAVILPLPGDTNQYYIFTHGVPSIVDGDDLVPDNDEDD